ncbi:hypothetical protein FBD94_13345 [Pedobacter hiemivivus]|jgi:hypothetical protein|uniref:Uncharacterized protein n=1 Tax=Pedobacter hiemivivus TaxID=2530454 RepID=A0A4U1G8C5_9SPHI|nr:hypothetical protein FBD94_13345 [Pedobacter hiemivivus]
MNRDYYKIQTNTNRMIYEFESEGPNGRIKKEVQYTMVNLDGFVYYNLGFGDLNINGDVDDLSISNNKDRDKILATVAQTVIQFTEYLPNALIYVEGSTPVRTRLYQMAIALNLKDISEFLTIYGLKNRQWHSFEKNTNYEAFLSLRK